MAPRFGALLLSVLLGFRLLRSAAALTIFDEVRRQLDCSEGLTWCNVSSGVSFSHSLPSPYGSVDVTQLQLAAALCVSAAKREYEPCLQITITLQGAVPEGSGGDEEEEGLKTDVGALVRVGLSSPSYRELWKEVRFKPDSHWSQPSSLQLLLTEKEFKVDFGLLVVVTAESKKVHVVQNVTFPDLDEVCHMKHKRNVTKCVVPRLRAVTQHENNVWLQILNADFKQKNVVCLVDWDGISGQHFTLPKGKREINISSIFVAPCLCFQTWWDGDDRRGKHCPFEGRKDALERMQHNLSVIVKESPLRSNRNGLTWNITSLCKVKGEVRLCKKDVTGSQCEEVVGSRQTLRDSWTKSSGTHWQSGEFSVSKHPLLCVQVKMDGLKSFSEPQCPFTTSRARWVLPLLIGLLLICLAILGAYLIQGVLKGYVWKWLKDDDVKGAVGGGHVVLLYPSDEDDDKRLPGILCHLGSSLQALGFTVSLDLWSQAELSVLGPVPWLHSRLDQLQRQGGKVVLILTRATWTRAEEWGAPNSEKNGVTNRNVEDELGRRDPPPSRRVDVFSASLSCILADYLQGRAGERFTLVQFESLPPEPPGGFRPLPQLFCGLRVYSLPSQSLGFLTELAGTKRMTSASARRKRAGGLRKASRALAQKLSGFSAGTNVFRLAGVSQGCVAVGAEDSGETVPLKPCLITPPSSPETGLKAGETEWV